MSSPHLWDASNILVLPSTILGNFRHADWKGAAKRGTLATLWELVRAATGWTGEPFFIPQRGKHPTRMADVRKLLAHNGIKAVWGEGYWNNELFFRVKAAQGDWARYLMLRAGIPLLHERG